MTIVGRNILEVYPKLITEVLATGQISAPRGKEVTEHGPIIWTIERPWEWALLIPGRRLNPFFALAEVVWMWSGKGGIEFIAYYNKSMRQFADEGVPYFNAAYGRRVRHAGYDERPYREVPYLITAGQQPTQVDVDQIDHVCRKIQADPETRQAVICLWDVVKDNFIKSNDHPCNNLVYFSQRGFKAASEDGNTPAVQGKLNVTVVIRSNDLIWGTPYNMVQFVHLQALVAAKLGAEMGTFTVMCNNLHFYHDLYKDTLDTVLGWHTNLGDHKVTLDRPADAFFMGWTSKTMLWDIDRFDGYVRNVWEPIEVQLRQGAETHANGAFYNSKLIKLYETFEHNHVPQYWQAIFSVMFMYHVRKAKFTEIVDDMMLKLPPVFRWLIEDFNNIEKE